HVRLARLDPREQFLRYGLESESLGGDTRAARQFVHDDQHAPARKSAGRHVAAAVRGTTSQIRPRSVPRRGALELTVQAATGRSPSTTGYTTCSRFVRAPMFAEGPPECRWAPPRL